MSLVKSLSSDFCILILLCFPPSHSKSFQRILGKQGLKFKLNTKVLSAEKKDGQVFLQAESVKDGKTETVRDKKKKSFSKTVI